MNLLRNLVDTLRQPLGAHLIIGAQANFLVLLRRAWSERDTLLVALVAVAEVAVVLYFSFRKCGR
jgi:hypothetical protein